MMTTGTGPLAHDLARVRGLLWRLAERDAAGPAMAIEATCELPGLLEVTRNFQLTAFERDVLLLALAVEVDDECGRAVASRRGRDDARRFTVGLALAALADLVAEARAPALASLLPDGHLVRCGLIELDGDGPHIARELRVPASVWPRLAGLSSDRPFAIATGSPPLAELILASSTRRAVERALSRGTARSPREVAIGVRGRPGSGREALALAMAAALGFPAFVVAGASLDDEPLCRAVVREALWGLAAVVVAGMPSEIGVSRLLRELATPLLVLLDESDSTAPLVARRPGYGEVEVAELDAGGRAAVWERALARLAGPRALDITGLARRHQLGAGRISTLCTIIEHDRLPGAALTEEDVAAARKCLSAAPGTALARRLECPYSWDDIVLVPGTERELRIIRAWARHGVSGMVSLFCGPPGTGKTMAAQVLARDLRLELLRIDLSQVVNKYIGETEKNLDRVFAIAEETGAVLFFDEADALFARRTEVRDANDRYANLETAFLLQRVESHRGLVIMATNLRKNFDAAFLRRIHVVAEFPMPEPGERRRIWERNLSTADRGDDLDVELFARQFAASGGEIHNAVATARLLATDEATPIGCRHIAIGMWRELTKSGRMLSPNDFGPLRGAIHGYLGK